MRTRIRQLLMTSVISKLYSPYKVLTLQEVSTSNKWPALRPIIHSIINNNTSINDGPAPAASFSRSPQTNRFMTVSLPKSVVLAITFLMASLSFVAESYSQVSLVVSPSAICSGNSRLVTFTITSNSVSTGGISIILPPGFSVVSVNPPTFETENGKIWSITGEGNSICLKAPDNSARLPTNSIISVTATINTTQPSSTTPYPITGF